MRARERSSVPGSRWCSRGLGDVGRQSGREIGDQQIGRQFPMARLAYAMEATSRRGCGGKRQVAGGDHGDLARVVSAPR